MTAGGCEAVVVALAGLDGGRWAYVKRPTQREAADVGMSRSPVVNRGSDR